MKTTTRIAALTVVFFIAGLAWLLRPVKEAPGQLPQKDSPHPANTTRAASPRTPSPKTTPRPSLTVDELVAIYEKHGADAALTAAKEITGPDRDSQILFILSYIARIDPEWVASSLAEAHLSIVHQGFVVSSVMADWKDGEKALAWASTFTGDLRKTAVGLALRILVRTHPEKALAHVQAMPASGNRSQAISDLFSSWGEHDPQAALAAIAQHLSPDEQASAMNLVARAWAAKSPQEALAWIATIQDQATADQLLKEAALAMKPGDLHGWLATLPDDSFKAGILESIAERDRNTIHCGFEQGPPDQSWKSKPVGEMTTVDLGNWVTLDPAGAEDYLEHATGEEDLSRLAITVAAAMSAREEPAAVFKWAQDLDGKASDPALRLAITSWAGKNPAEAAGAIDQVSPERRPALASALADIWCRNDPAAAAAWAATYPGNHQQTLVREVLEQWVGSEPREAYAWLNTLPVGATRDEGISYMIIREAPSDPASLTPWIELLSTPGLRAEKRRVLDEYTRSKPAAGPHGE